MNLFLRIIFFIFTFPFVLVGGIIAGLISVPLSIIVGIPGFIIKEVWDKYQTTKAAKAKLLSRLQQAKDLKAQIDQLKLNLGFKKPVLRRGSGEEE